jgi:hypothetical protein
MLGLLIEAAYCFDMVSQCVNHRSTIRQSTTIQQSKIAESLIDLGTQKRPSHRYDETGVNSVYRNGFEPFL